MSASSQSGRTLLRTVLLVLVGIVAWYLKQQSGDTSSESSRTESAVESQSEAGSTPRVTLPSEEAGSSSTATKETSDGDGGAARIAQAFARGESDLQIEVDAVVSRSLPDDNEGSRHQRFILKLSDGGTVLVAHNIDLAPRVPLREGDRVQVFGEYEWNDRGGVLHWTHHDPGRRHVGGWIKHGGKTYE